MKKTNRDKSQPSYPSYFPDPHFPIPRDILESRCDQCLDRYVFGKDGAGVYSVEWKDGTEYYNVGKARRIIKEKGLKPMKPPGGVEMCVEMMLINQVDRRHVGHLKEEWLEVPGILGEREPGKYVFMDGSHRLAGRMMREGIALPEIIGITKIPGQAPMLQWNRMVEMVRNFQGMECWVMGLEETMECTMTEKQWEEEVGEKERWLDEWVGEYMAYQSAQRQKGKGHSPGTK